MFTHLSPGQQQARTRWNTHESGAAFDRKKTAFLTDQAQEFADCRFEVYFVAQSSKSSLIETAEQIARRNARQQLADLVLSVLPDEDGATLLDLQMGLQHRQVSPNQLRPSVLLEALRHLQHAGLVASTANQPEDDLYRRRYWRVPTTGEQLI